jgi:hypothetical protein
MGHKHPFRVYPVSLPVPGGVPEMPGCRFYPYTPDFSRFHDKAGGNVNYPAGNLQFFAEFLNCRRIPPALLLRPYAVLHMKAPQNKAPFSPQTCQSRKHSRRIGPAGNCRQELRPPQPFPKGIIYSGFKRREAAGTFSFM